MSVRTATRDDIDRIGHIAEATGLFPAEYLPEMIAPALAGGEDDWRVVCDDDGPVGFAFARPEALTDRTWNILAIAVDPAKQGQGHASRLLATLEADMDARLIIIETTQLDEQQRARDLYTARGYEQQGHVRDFFADGEDKVIFRKAVS